jgi:hypothetical protein
LWGNLTGGAKSHFFAKDLEKNSEICATVMNKLQYYIHHVQDIYPALVNVKGDAILSAPNAPVQFEGHSQRLHSDYAANVLE